MTGEVRPAFYAARSGGWRDWWTILHPPYTAWHLSYVVIGACLAPRVDGLTLVATLLAFFLAVGVAAHAFDELHGRPLGTGIPAWALVAAGAAGLGGAVALGVAGLLRLGPGLAAFVVVGVMLVIGYNLELFGGRVHSDFVFAAAWGAFPVLTAYYAQAASIGLAAIAAAVFAFFLSGAQRHLSTPARALRRRTRSVTGTATMLDGTIRSIDVRALLGPLESTLRALTWSTVALACALAVDRFVGR